MYEYMTFILLATANGYVFETWSSRAEFLIKSVYGKILLSSVVLSFTEMISLLF